MAMQRLLFLLCIYIMLFGHASGQCVDYIDIGDEKRSINYTIGVTEPAFCDKYILTSPDAWYRFVQYTGEQMPEFCPEKGSCGTESPIWMNGTHPTEVNETVEAMACSHTATCCTFSDPMKVKLCEVAGERFYVYQLPLVTRCPLSYCAGDGIPCTDSERWDPSHNKCIETTTTSTTTTTATTTASTFSSLVATTSASDHDKRESGFPIWAILIVCSVSIVLVAILTSLCVYVHMRKNQHPLRVSPRDLNSRPNEKRGSSPPPPYSPPISKA